MTSFQAYISITRTFKILGGYIPPFRQNFNYKLYREIKQVNIRSMQVV